MNFFILITSFLFVLPVQSRTTNRCPPPTSILPCTCDKDHWVVCINVDSLDSVFYALNGKFPEPIQILEITKRNVSWVSFLLSDQLQEQILPRLEITNFSSLPQHALGDTRVEKLILTDNGIIDIHDEAFDGQDSLWLLWLRNQHLTDIPTEALKVLPGLRSLDLECNYITEIRVNSFDLESRLRFLYLNNNSISIIERGAFPRSLETLRLDNNHLSTLNSSLLHMDSLEMLFADNNKLNSIRGEFRCLSVLNTLGLESNEITSIEGAFDDLISLTDLNLANNRLQDLEGLLPLKNLRRLHVADNQITSLGENTFSSQKSLVTLDLSGNRIRNVCQAIKPLRNLEHLRLSNMSLTFLFNNCLKGMQHLRKLDLSLNGFTNIDFVTEHSFPEMRYLSVKCNLLQKINHGFKNLQNLYDLDISFNRFFMLKNDYFIHNSFLVNITIGGNSLINTAQCGY